VVEVWYIDSLVDDQDHTFASQCIIVRNGGRDCTKVIVYRAIRVESSDIDWTVKIMDY
jgi:hypothetical protein